MQELEYTIGLKQSATALRRICLRRMQQVYNRQLPQTQWRYAANVYARHNGPHINPEHLKWDWPAPVANSKVDIYHHGYFIRATLAAIYYPEEPLLYETYLLAPICSVEDNEMVRREHQVALYTKLSDLIPAITAATIVQAPPPHPWAQDLTAIHLKLDRILGALHGSMDTNNTTQTRPPDQGKTVDGSGDKGSKLDPKKPPTGKRRHNRPKT